MSAHSRDMEEDARSHRSDSSEQDDDLPPNRIMHQIPGDNPSNVDDDATINDGKNAKKPTKKRKMFGRPVSQGPEYAETRTPNINDRADGGYINPENARPRDRRMRWIDAADRQLLIFGFGREIASREYKAISDTYPEKPTEKAIMERITKLRGQTRTALKDSGIFDPNAVRSSGPDAGPATSSPAKPLPKKARLSTSKGAAALPGAGTPSQRSQPQPQPEQQVQMPQGPQSFQPHPSQPPQMAQQGSQQSLQNQPAYPAGTVWQTTYTPTPAATANMLPAPTVSQQYTNPELVIPPVGLPSFQPHGGQYGVYPGNGMLQASGSNLYRDYPQQQQQMPTFVQGSYTPSHLVQQPPRAIIDPSVPGMGGSGQGDDQDDLVRSERELQARLAEREATKKAFQPPK